MLQSSLLKSQVARVYCAGYLDCKHILIITMALPEHFLRNSGLKVFFISEETNIRGSDEMGYS